MIVNSFTEWLHFCDWGDIDRRGEVSYYDGHVIIDWAPLRRTCRPRGRVRMTILTHCCELNIPDNISCEESYEYRGPTSIAVHYERYSRGSFSTLRFIGAIEEGDFPIARDDPDFPLPALLTDCNGSFIFLQDVSDFVNYIEFLAPTEVSDSPPC